MNFEEAYETVKLYVNRKDEADSITIAKAEVNAAVRFANQMHAFKYAEGLAKVTYPANEMYVDIEAICDARIIEFLSIQKLANVNDHEGLPILMREYQTIQAERQDRAGRDFVLFDDFDVNTSDQFASKVSRRYGHWAFLNDQGLGLYPTPTADVCLLIQYNKRLPPLVNDTDTNFLLTHGRDFIIDRAVARVTFRLKSDDRQETISQFTAESWAELLQWDKTVRRTSNML